MPSLLGNGEAYWTEQDEFHIHMITRGAQALPTFRCRHRLALMFFRYIYTLQKLCLLKARSFGTINIKSSRIHGSGLTSATSARMRTNNHREIVPARNMIPGWIYLLMNFLLLKKSHVLGKKS